MANQVRPEVVLEQALTHIKLRWREAEDGDDDEARAVGIAWAKEQLLSLRQDMVVQHIGPPSTLPIRVQTSGQLFCPRTALERLLPGRLHSVCSIAIVSDLGKF